MWLREIFEHFGLQSFPKTSGSKGLQIYVPLNTPTSYEATKPFAHALARLLEDQHRDLVVSDMKKELRKGKVLVDWSQNDEHKTTIAVYSLRAREHPTVSTPVKWEEVEHMLKKKDSSLLVFEADQVLKRVEKMGDLFEPVLTLKQTLPKLTADVGAGAPSPALRASPARAAGAVRERSSSRTGLKIAAQAGRPKKTVKPGTRKAAVKKSRKDIIRDHGATLRGNFRMGVSQLEAGVLSCQASAEKFPAALRHAAQHGRSQFYFPAIDQRDDRPEVDRGDAAGISLWGEGSPGHYPHQAVKGDGRFRAAVSQHD